MQMSSSSTEDLELLFKGLRAFSNFAIGFNNMGVLVATCQAFSNGLTTGGPAAMIWSWLAIWALTSITSLSMAEICAAFPYGELRKYIFHFAR